MAKGSFLYKDLSQSATFGGSTPVTGLDWSFLKDPQPRHRTRVNASSANLILDLGAAVSIDIATLIGTGMDSTSTARLRMSASDATVTGSLAYDSTVLASVTDAAWTGAVIGCLPAPVTARYIRWDVVQGGAPIDIGLAPCGLLWRPSRNFSFGGMEGRSDASRREVNPDTGAEFGLALAQRRTKRLTFAALTKSEVRTDLDAMDRLVGAGGDVLFVEDSDASWADRARDAVWGSFRESGSGDLTSRQAVNVFSRSFLLTERI
jgi:hypothetical protein